MIAANLPYGVVSIYGAGSLDSLYGMTGQPGQLFGRIDQVSPYGGTPYVAVNDSVLFNGDDILCRVSYFNQPYTILPVEKIILTETPIP